MEPNTTVTTPAVGNKQNNNGIRWKIATVIASIVAICGIGFGGFELWLNIKESQIPPALLSLDKGNSLGRKLYEQIQSVTATDWCGQVYYPLYEFSEGEYYIIEYKDLPDSVKFEIIAKEIPEIANLKSGEKIIVSGEKMEEAFNSVFGGGGREYIYYDIFGFTDLGSEEHIETQQVQLLDYNIEELGNNEFLVSLKRKGPSISCIQPRYHSRYEYIGLSSTTNSQMVNNNEDDNRTAMIVLEKKTTDIEDDKEWSDGYYGVLFNQSGEDFFWVGAYYLGK